MDRNRYMMATKANDDVGSANKGTPTLCLIHDEDGENYIGHWMPPLDGLLNLKFPRNTTRELTPEEKLWFNGLKFWVDGWASFTVQTIEKVKIDESPKIALPKDAYINYLYKNKLEAKLKEYKKQVEDTPNQLQMPTICKIVTLKRLLRDNEINIAELANEMAKVYGDDLKTKDFLDAILAVSSEITAIDKQSLLTLNQA